jgi:hypothetical protein
MLAVTRCKLCNERFWNAETAAEVEKLIGGLLDISTSKELTAEELRKIAIKTILEYRSAND